MANNLQWTGNFTVTNGSYTNTWLTSDSYTQNAQGAAGGIASTTTTAANLDVGSVTTLGFLLLRNLDSTNACDWGISVSSTFQAVGTLNAGEGAIFRLKQGVTFMLKAEAGTPAIQYLLLQN